MEVVILYHCSQVYFLDVIHRWQRDDFCVPEAHRGHSGKREPSVQRERGRKQGDVLRKLHVALDGCGSASWGPGYAWGLTEEGSWRATWGQSPEAPVRHLDSGELSKAFRKENNGSDLVYGHCPLQGPTEKWMGEGRGESGLEMPWAIQARDDAGHN